MLILATGMKFDIPASSVANSSSTWGGNVPTRMLNRRGAAMPIASISNSSSPAPPTPGQCNLVSYLLIKAKTKVIAKAGNFGGFCIN